MVFGTAHGPSMVHLEVVLGDRGGSLRRAAGEHEATLTKPNPSA